MAKKLETNIVIANVALSWKEAYISITACFSMAELPFISCKGKKQQQIFKDIYFSSVADNFKVIIWKWTLDK